ncbi:MAG: peptide chain release factor N(5)-glutamine methyltransferase [Chloroflexi bacterium]|nr:peptide chain release factor N(5)-glutamine methyltransferase [Chloroflexota bacterium]
MSQEALPAGSLSVRDALRWAVRVLISSGSDSPRLDAEVLLAHALGIKRSQLPLYWEEVLSAEVAEAFTSLVRRRAAHEPVAYLVGRRAFYDLDVCVDARVLIPRPESELLVEEALSWAHARDVQRVADVGTGSGALAIALARHLPSAWVWGTDLSPEALAVAHKNARCHGIEGRIGWVCCDLLSALAGPFEIIVANLPYIPTEEIATLPPDVAAYEPHLALDGGPGGLTVIERLLQQVPERLSRPGLLLLEIDSRQAERAVALAGAFLPDAHIAVLRDLAGLPRVVRVVREG